MGSHVAGGARRPAVRRRPPGAGGIRWDRVGRLALVAMLGVIVLLYVSPVKHWIQQSGTQTHQQQRLDQLQQENARLEGRLRYLKRPDSVDREARRMGMVKRGERAFVVPRDR
jgi:cell division protein FtsB